MLDILVRTVNLLTSRWSTSKSTVDTVVGNDQSAASSTIDPGNDSATKEALEKGFLYADDMPWGHRIKRPRHCVYCLKCLHIHDKVAVGEYTNRLGISTISPSSWRHHGTDPFVPILEEGCEVGEPVPSSHQANLKMIRQICAFQELIRLANNLGYSDDAERYEQDLKEFRNSGSVKKISEKDRKEFGYHQRHGHFRSELKLSNFGPISFAKSFFDVTRLPGR